MPVPGRNVDDDAAGLNRAMQHRRDIGEDKSQYAASQMKAMHGSENVNEGTAGAADEVKASAESLRQTKSCRQEIEDGDGGQSEPGEAALVAERDARIDWTGASAASRVISRRAKSMVMLLTIRTGVLAAIAPTAIGPEPRFGRNPRCSDRGSGIRDG